MPIVRKDGQPRLIYWDMDKDKTVNVPLPTAEQLSVYLPGEIVAVDGVSVGVYMGQGKLRMFHDDSVLQFDVPAPPPPPAIPFATWSPPIPMVWSSAPTGMFNAPVPSSSGAVWNYHEPPKQPKHYQSSYNSNDVACGLSDKVRDKLKHERTQELKLVTCRNCLDALEIAEQEQAAKPKQAVAGDVLVGVGRRIVID